MTFYLRVVKTIFYERVQRVSKILFLTRENCINTKSHVIDIFTSEDMENMSLCISQYLTLYYIINIYIYRVSQKKVLRFDSL
jgi:predicted P-loop ATPase/GTPase